MILLMELAKSAAGVGCHWGGLFVGALAYADYLTLLAPSASVLRMLVGIRVKYHPIVMPFHLHFIYIWMLNQVA